MQNSGRTGSLAVADSGSFVQFLAECPRHQPRVIVGGPCTEPSRLCEPLYIVSCCPSLFFFSSGSRIKMLIRNHANANLITILFLQFDGIVHRLPRPHVESRFHKYFHTILYMSTAMQLNIFAVAGNII